MEEEDTLRRRRVISAARDTIDTAGRLLRKKLPIGGHLLTPRKLWLQSIATRQCDVVITFPKGALDSTLLWLLRKLRSASPRLTVCVRQHASTQSTAFYLTASFQVLLRAAEEIHLPKTLRPEFGGGLKEFTLRDLHCFQKSDCPDEFLTTLERQELVLHQLEAVRASNGEPVPQSLKLRPGQSIVPVCLSAGLIDRVFPIHETDKLQELRETWVRAVFSPQPLDNVRAYFGVKVAMYFAWLGHYTAALTVPAITGFCFWVFMSSVSDNWRDMAYVLFSLFNILWACIYLQTWKRYSNELAYKWGTLDQRDDLLIEPRPLYQGEIVVSSVTGRLEPVFPAWKRRLWRHLVSVPAIFLCLIAVAVTSYIMLTIQDWWEDRVKSRAFLSWLSVVPRIVLAVIIATMDHFYYRVATWLNDKVPNVLGLVPNKETFAWIACFFSNVFFYEEGIQFQFVNSFLSLFYLAFYLQDQEKLKEQLAALLIARQVLGNLRESAWPYLLEHLRLARLSFAMFGALSPSKENIPSAFGKDNNGEGTPSKSLKKVTPKNSLSEDTLPDVKEGTEMKQRNISQAELESQLFRYDGTFAEHLEMVMQLGYVVLFSSAFPLAGLCALINNLVEVRGDAFKLCFVTQRPFGKRVNSIGSWQHAMEVMVGIAVLVNCALIGLSGTVHRMFPEATPIQTILVIVALEHVMLVMVLLVKLAIPEMPAWLATEMAKVEFQRREASRNTHTPLQTESGGNSSGTSQEDLLGEDQPTRTSVSDDAMITPEERLLIGRFTVQRMEQEEKPADAHKISTDKLFVGDNDVFESSPSSMEIPISRAGSRRVSEREEGRSRQGSSGTPPSTTPRRSFIPEIPPFRQRNTPSPTHNVSQPVAQSETPAPARSPLIAEIPPFRPKKSPSPTRHWPHEAEHPGVHLTVGPTGADWAPRPLRTATLAGREPLHRSTHCIPPAAPTLKLERKELLTVNSGSEPELIVPKGATTPGAATTPQTEAPAPIPSTSEEEKPKTKKLSPATAALVKRARSVAVFSLRLRKAREAAAAKNSAQQETSPPKPLPPPVYGGELSLIPLEQLIQLEDVKPRTTS